MEVVDRLSETRFCEGMEARHIRLLAEGANEIGFNPNDFIFRERGEARQFYIIYSGKVSLEVATLESSAIVFQTIGAGDALGLSWLFPPFEWHFDARALEPTLMFVTDAASLREKLEDDHDFGFEMLKRLAQVMVVRLQATRLQMTDMYGGRD